MTSEEHRGQKLKNSAMFFAAVLGGVFTDFLFVGVLKIVWVAIYGTVYLTCASTLYTFLSKSRFKKITLSSSLGFFATAFIFHFSVEGVQSNRTYLMDLDSYPPPALHSPKFAQLLIVESDRLQSLLPEKNLTKEIPVSFAIIKDYGCIRSFKVKTVAGIDVMDDVRASWTLKAEKGYLFTSTAPPDPRFDGMAEENMRLPWCHFKWYEVM
jgi:hypothetical protein